MYAVCYEDEIRLWWDPRRDFKPGYRFKVTVNGVSVVYTPNIYYDFKNLDAGKDFDFEVQLLDELGNPVGHSDSKVFSTLRYREKIDVTKAPYFAKGDGETDNTEILQKALDDCDEDHYLYFPLGIYICSALKFSSGKIRLDSGAVLCSKKGVNKLC